MNESQNKSGNPKKKASNSKSLGNRLLNQNPGVVVSMEFLYMDLYPVMAGDKVDGLGTHLPVWGANNLGCAMSHRRVYEKMIAEKWPCALIFAPCHLVIDEDLVVGSFFLKDTKKL